MAKSVARYVSRTKNYCLHYGTSDVGIIGYTDAYHGGDKETRTYWWICILARWRCISVEQQNGNWFGISSLEAEYVAQARAVRVALCVWELMKDFRCMLVLWISTPITWAKLV